MNAFKAALSQIDSYDNFVLSHNQLILASMSSIQSYKITHNRTDINCLENCRIFHFSLSDSNAFRLKTSIFEPKYEENAT